MAVFEPAAGLEWCVKFPKGMAGDLKREGVKDQITIQGVEWTIEREWGTGSAITNRPMNAPKMEQLNFTRETDKSSIQMYYWCASGEPFSKVYITGYTIRNDKALEIYKLECDNCAITKVAFSPDPMTDTFELSFSKLTWTYNHWEQDGDDVKIVKKIEHNWDYLLQKGS